MGKLWSSPNGESGPADSLVSSVSGGPPPSDSPHVGSTRCTFFALRLAITAPDLGGRLGPIFARRAVGVSPSHAEDSLRGHSRGRRSVDGMPTDPPATLAAWLRTRSDEQLGALLVARPDVARPAPSDGVALASRLAVPVSVDRALDELDAATLQVLDVVLLAPTDGVAPDELIAALPDLPDDVLTEALERLTTRALLWGDDVLHAPDPVRRAVRHPAGLGRRATELRVQLPGDLRAVLAELPADERDVLERLAGDRPVGHLPDAPAD